MSLVASTAHAAVSDPPAALDFGLIFGGWGVYADGDGEPDIPNQSYEIYGVPTSFDDSWSMTELSATATAFLSGSASLSTEDETLTLNLGISASVIASVGPDAPSPDAVAIAEAFIDEVYLSFEVFTESRLLVESLESDGGWTTVTDLTLAAGFADMSLDGAFLSVTAGPGETIEDQVDLTWRVTVAAIPGPAGGVLFAIAGLGRRRRRRR